MCPPVVIIVLPEAVILIGCLFPCAYQREENHESEDYTADPEYSPYETFLLNTQLRLLRLKLSIEDLIEYFHPRQLGFIELAR